MMVHKSGLASLASCGGSPIFPMGKIATFAFLAFVFVWFLAASAGAQVSVLTQNADTERDAVYSNETQLTPTSTIHKLFTMSLDAPVMGQALVLGGLNVSGYPTNVLLVTTSSAEGSGATSARAFNADTGAKLWQLSLGTNAAFTTATPVVDPTLGPHGALFVVTLNSSTNANQLHAIDVLAGTELTGSPVTISATASGVALDSAQENARAALLDVNGTIYTSFCHMTDSGTYHGWLIGYKYTNGSGFSQNGVWCDTCANGGNQGGIWQGGDGVIYDGTSIFVATGNGTIGNGDYSMSIVQLSPSNLGTVESSYLPPNAQANSNGDADLNGGGMVIMPGTGGKIFIGPTKYGALYLVNDADLGAAAINTYSTNSAVGHSPIAWNSGSAQYAYVWPRGTGLQQYCYTGGSTGNAACEQSTTLTSGGTLAISSTPTGANAILWAYGGNELHALNPMNVTAADYWNSNQTAGDSTGSGPGNFQYIAVANGKVYVPSGDTLIAYGTPVGTSCAAAPTVPGSLSATTASSSEINLSWTASTVGPGCSITYNVYESTASGFTPGSSNLIANNVSGTTYSAAELAASTTYYYVVEAVDSFGSSTASTQASATTSTGSTTEGPYGGRAAAIPGTVLAENYDTGGQGVAYNVTAVNGTDNAYRSDGVDLETASALATGNDIGWTAAGQWFRYTVNVATAGTYTVSILVAAPAAVADAFHISNSTGTNLSGFVALPATGGYQAWVTVTATVTLPAGTQTLTVNQDEAGWNIDSMIFASLSSSGTDFIAINFEGPAISNSGGGDAFFAADEDFTGGGAATPTTATISTTSAGANAAPMAVYQTQRVGTFTYTIPGMVAGSTHTVLIHFAEIYFSAAGDREFNVAINGTNVLTNFDQFAAAGGKDIAVVKTFTATANSSDQIVVAFTSGAVNQPSVAGLEIR